MKTFKALIAALLLFSVLLSCRKHKEVSQEGRERSEPLLANEIIDDEHGGLTFFLYPPAGTEISIQVYQGTTPIETFEELPNSRYSVLSDDLPINTEFILELHFKSVAQPGTFDFMSEGFTAWVDTKRFWLKAIPITAADAGKKKQFLRIKKGVVKFAFTSIP